MEPIIFFNNEMLTVAIISILIFISRVLDVSLGTLRVISIAHGKRYLAPVFGLFEISIWLLVAQQILTDISNIWFFLAYALGYSVGNFVGIVIEGKFNDSKVLMRIITNRTPYQLQSKLAELQCSFNVIDGARTDGKTGYHHDISIIFMTVNRKKLDKVIEILRKYDPKSQFSIEDVRYATDEYDDIAPRRVKVTHRIGLFRKGK